MAGNILDLVISSDEILINHLTVEARILADHMSILFVLNFRVQKKCNFVDRKQFSRCNDLIAFLSHINWYLIYEISTDVTAFWQELQLVMKYGIDTFIPVKRVSKVKKSLFPTQPDTDEAIIEKRRCYNQWSVHKSVFWKNWLRYWTKRCKWLVNRDRSAHESSVAANPNPNRFHSYIRKVLDRPSVIPDLEVENVIY